ncbi:MAG: hypothetical protein AAF675_00765 [Pseudomonadota bacterium]
MSEPETPETAAQSADKGKPYAEMSGMNDALAARRDAADAEAEVAAAPEAAPEASPEPVGEPTPEAASEAASEAAPAGATASESAPKAAPAAPVSGAAPKRPNAQAPARPTGRSAAAVWLALLIGVIAGITVISVAGPQLAPHLPQPLADFVTQSGTTQAKTVAALQERVETLEAEGAASGSMAERLDALEGTIAGGEDYPGYGDAINVLGDAVGVMAKRVSLIEDEVAALTERFAALEAGAGTGAGAAVAAGLAERVDALETAEPEVTAPQLAELGARIATIEARPEVATAAQLGETIARIAAIEAGLQEAADRAELAKAELVAAKAEAKRKADGLRLRAGAEALKVRLRQGDTFAVVLDDLAALTGQAPPEALSAAAEGLVSLADLDATFPDAAQAALRVDAAESAEETTSGQLLGWLSSQVIVQPTQAREGTDVAAYVSRIGAALREGKSSTALMEAEAMPDYAKTAMGRWLDDLRARVEAETALTAWLGELGVLDEG